MADRCDLTELLVTECACRLHRNLADPGADPDARPFSTGPGPWFVARFPNCCPCGEPIREGDEIRANGFEYVGRCCEGEER